MQSNLPHINLTIQHGAISPFCTLLQNGISISSHTGINIEDFLTEIPGLSPEYIQNELETIFLDGNPVDDLNTKFHKSEHTLALSAIMPGLVGAILRKNSIHAPLRTTSVSKNYTQTTEKNVIKLKLFNRIAQECGPKLLAATVTFDNSNLLKTFKQRPHLLNNIKQISKNNIIVNTDDFLATLIEFQQIRLSAYESEQ